MNANHISHSLRPSATAPEPISWGRLSVLLSVAWLGAVCLPLATYTLTLALFGLAHVAEELRYLQSRFGGWLRSVAGPLLLALAGVAGVRALRWLDLLSSDLGQPLELLAALVLLWIPVRWWWTTPQATGLALAASVALLVGLLVSPITALVAVAVLHNLTPVPLIAEALPRSSRRRFWVAALVVFGLMPATIATGWPWELVAGVAQADAGLLPSGSLAANYTAYLPIAMARMPNAQHWFSAIVFMQCVHYTAVLGVLPAWAPPRARWWLPMLAVATMLLVVGYTVDFREARSAYGIVSSVHAWIEVPIVVLLLLPARPAVKGP